MKDVKFRDLLFSIGSICSDIVLSGIVVVLLIFTALWFMVLPGSLVLFAYVFLHNAGRLAMGSFLLFLLSIVSTILVFEEGYEDVVFGFIYGLDDITDDVINQLKESKEIVKSLMKQNSKQNKENKKQIKKLEKLNNKIQVEIEEQKKDVIKYDDMVVNEFTKLYNDAIRLNGNLRDQEVDRVEELIKDYSLSIGKISSNNSEVKSSKLTMAKYEAIKKDILARIKEERKRIVNLRNSSYMNVQSYENIDLSNHEKAKSRELKK